MITIIIIISLLSSMLFLYSPLDIINIIISSEPSSSAGGWRRLERFLHFREYSSRASNLYAQVLAAYADISLHCPQQLTLSVRPYWAKNKYLYTYVNLSIEYALKIYFAK